MFATCCIIIHNATAVKQCRYFSANQACPFEELGCKFLHRLSEEINANKDEKENLDDKVPAIQERHFKCEECNDNSQCESCIVRQWNSQYGDLG